jgi:hypothetical protein
MDPAERLPFAVRIMRRRAFPTWRTSPGGTRSPLQLTWTERVLHTARRATKSRAGGVHRAHDRSVVEAGGVRRPTGHTRRDPSRTLAATPVVGPEADMVHAPPVLVLADRPHVGVG